ncbi:MAG: mercury methylation ferredoxin HgcB [Deltaproteobacteria bacterium]|nr:mercury methylation ferredoxin HgcB [Deltaproteobacteria bacterium]
MNRLSYLKDVTTLALDEQKCIGCGMCLEVCPHAVFGMQERRAQIIDRDACMECGACRRNCPAEAVTVQAGVGCAAAIINVILGRTDQPCCGGDTGCGSGKTCC